MFEICHKIALRIGWVGKVFGSLEIFPIPKSLFPDSILSPILFFLSQRCMSGYIVRRPSQRYRRVTYA